MTLVDIITKYKHNWDNERFIASNHKLVCDIQRTARKNMVASQKKVEEALKAKQLMVSDNSVKILLQDLQKKYKYYRISLYTFAMASFIEVMQSGNFSEKNICSVIEIIEKCSSEYRDLFGKCSEYLERISLSSVESTLWKGIGFASDTFGKFIGSIPKVRDGQVDEFLLDQGKKIKQGAEGIKRNILETFAEVSNPGTGTLIAKLRDMDQIYNHTKVIGFDSEKLFLIA